MTKLSKYLWMVESYLLDLSIYYPFQVNIHNLKVHKVKICFNHVIFIKKAIKWPENSANLSLIMFPHFKGLLFAEFSAEKNCPKFHFFPLLNWVFFFSSIRFFSPSLFIGLFIEPKFLKNWSLASNAAVFLSKITLDGVSVPFSKPFLTLSFLGNPCESKLKEIPEHFGRFSSLLFSNFFLTYLYFDLGVFHQ